MWKLLTRASRTLVIRTHAASGILSNLRIVGLFGLLCTMLTLGQTRQSSPESNSGILPAIRVDVDPGLVAARLDLIERLPQPEPGSILPLSRGIQSALENRWELKQAEYDAENQEINIQYTKNQMLPVLDITAGYTHSGLGGTKTLRSGLGTGAEIVQVIPGGIGDMFTQLFGFNYPGYSAGFTLQIPLRNGSAKADYKRNSGTRQLHESAGGLRSCHRQHPGSKQHRTGQATA